MLTFLRRCLTLAAGAAALALGCLTYLYTQLPDTFMVPQGQALALAQMPWLVPLEPKGAAAAQAVPTGGSYNVTLSVLGGIPVKTVRAVVVDRRAVTVCGTPFGIKMFSDGAMVVAFTDIRTRGGMANPAKAAGLKMGDVIVSIDGHKTVDNDDVSAAIQAAEGRSVQLVYLRDGAQHTTALQPVQDADSERWRAGMWVRDSSAGIGTLTFVDNSTGVYGGLGHSISDADTGRSIALLSGEVAPVTITGYVAGAAGAPGELKGRFTGEAAMGDILINGATGVYGSIRRVLDGQDMVVAQSQEVCEGPARILTTIGGDEPGWYDAVIEQISLTEEDPNRNMVIRITDPELLAATGGIVQGMSGSPIVQNDRLVGAVTHVLVNDPTRGFGIFAENMLASADAAAARKAA